MLCHPLRFHVWLCDGKQGNTFPEAPAALILRPASPRLRPGFSFALYNDRLLSLSLCLWYHDPAGGRRWQFEPEASRQQKALVATRLDGGARAFSFPIIEQKKEEPHHRLPFPNTSKRSQTQLSYCHHYIRHPVCRQSLLYQRIKAFLAASVNVQ